MKGEEDFKRGGGFDEGRRGGWEDGSVKGGQDTGKGTTKEVQDQERNRADRRQEIRRKRGKQGNPVARRNMTDFKDRRKERKEEECFQEFRSP